MTSWLESLLLAFVALFIVIDALGNLPFVMSLSEGMSRHDRRKMIDLAMITATIVGLAFLFFGQFILHVMGISVGAFAIAGGIILLVLSIKYMITGKIIEAFREEMIAVVPIGTPLLAGPATITTLLLLVGQFPLYIVLVAFVLNLLIAWIIFLLGNRIIHFMGQGGLRAVSNVFNLLLAAIAITMIIRGLGLLDIVNVNI
jgi:multiple antibiotic resistance protein